ncbi:MAG TPA: DsbA family protein [Kofleriaceae bacterium]|jgi:2-hydroxychromene-2-carboxylate isomerase|nr:DsbA family protein [Kofleriaceae bacterium]
MTLVSRLKGAAIGAFLDADRARHVAAELRRRVTGGDRVVDFYFDLADPWSYLAAQAAVRLAAAYPVEIKFHLVSPPASDVDAKPALRAQYAIRDAAELALHWDLDFPGKKPLEAGALRKAGQVLIKPRPDRDQLALAVELGRALWANDQKELTALMGRHGNEASGSLPPFLASAYDRLRKAGHYQGAMFAYGGDWYWGVDRLSYLENRLATDTGTSAPPVLNRRPEAERPPERLTSAPGPLAVDFFFSFRSPFSYLALGRTAELARRFPIDLRVRPVLPMIERGVALPAVKRMYLVRDAHREAERLGIPFGNICDPLGQGVEHALAISKLAIAQGRGLEFLESAARGSWAEAKDLTSYVDLREVVERAGLSWSDARAAMGDPSWRVWATDNAADLDAAGLWGVPAWKVGDHATWGQDRIDFLADRLRRHAAAPTSAKAEASP